VCCEIPGWNLTAPGRVYTQRSERNMTFIDFKTAVKKALDFLAGVYADEDLRDVRLEEIELSEDDKFWNITLSYRRYAPPASSVSGATELIAGAPPREYKVIAVRLWNGEVRSMKIRQPV